MSWGLAGKWDDFLVWAGWRAREAKISVTVAAEAVKAGTMSEAQAARLANVSKSQIKNAVEGLRGIRDHMSKVSGVGRRHLAREAAKHGVTRGGAAILPSAPALIAGVLVVGAIGAGIWMYANWGEPSDQPVQAGPAMIREAEATLQGGNSDVSASPAQAGGGVDASVAASGDLGEGQCRVRSYSGSATVAVEGLPSGSAVIAIAELAVAADCVTEAHIVWAGEASDQDWVTAKNPNGIVCTLAEADAGRQFSAPDVPALTLSHQAGAETLTGWMTVQTGSTSGPCPPTSDIGMYIGQPVGGLFTANINGDQLSGSGDLSGETERAVSISLRAFEQASP
jgi:hypothetical protein